MTMVSIYFGHCIPLLHDRDITDCVCWDHWSILFAAVPQSTLQCPVSWLLLYLQREVEIISSDQGSGQHQGRQLHQGEFQWHPTFSLQTSPGLVIHVSHFSQGLVCRKYCKVYSINFPLPPPDRLKSYSWSLALNRTWMFPSVRRQMPFRHISSLSLASPSHSCLWHRLASPPPSRIFS